jgi:hypothetical protein
MATATELPFLAGTNPRSASSAVGKGPTTDPHVLSKRGLRVSDTRSEHEPNLARNAPVGYQPVNERGDGHRVPGAKCGGTHDRLGTERPEIASNLRTAESKSSYFALRYSEKSSKFD